jgi:hypothetical protein
MNTPEVKIPFQFDVWKSGKFERIETEAGLTVDQLYVTELTDILILIGTADFMLHMWTWDGKEAFSLNTQDSNLRLIVKQ